MDGILDSFFNPLHLNFGTVKSLAHVEKVLGEFQCFAMALCQISPNDSLPLFLQ